VTVDRERTLRRVTDPPRTAPPPARAAARLALVGAAALIVAVMTGCAGGSGRTPADQAGHGRVRVVASIAPLADLARRVGGDRVEVLTLIPPGASEHTWEPTPRAMARMEKVRLFLEVGAGFETWSGRLVDAASSGTGRVTVVDASEGVDLLADPDEHGAHGDPDGTEHANPHYWLDPVSVSLCIPRIADALAAIDPDGAEGYRARGAQARDEIAALDREIRARTAGFSSREIVTFHAAWDYFARRYGLTVVASIEAFPGREPGPRRITQIVDLVRREKVRAVFAEPQSSAKAAEAIAAECGIPVRLLDPLGGEAIAGREDYSSLMRYNVGMLEEVLR